MPARALDYARHSALIVVDMQNDFAHPEGSLYVAGGDEIIDVINREIGRAREAGATVVLTQDWHPARTPHFDSDGGTWPPHCVGGTWGAALHDDLDSDADLVLRKGTGGEDGYSAFAVVDPDSHESRSTGLAGYLRDRGIADVTVVGLAADVCVKATALDAAAAGLRTTVRWDATRAVELEPADGRAAASSLAAAGVTVVDPPA